FLRYFKFNLLFLPRFQGFMWATVCFSWYFQPVPVKSCLLIKLVYCINLHFITFTKPEYRPKKTPLYPYGLGFAPMNNSVSPLCARTVYATSLSFLLLFPKAAGILKSFYSFLSVKFCSF